MNGKQKCRILKDIRREIARQNDIDLVIEACAHRGECPGTCPRCEAEVRLLERELEKRRQLQKRVALAGVAAGVTLALSGCSAIEQFVENLPPVDEPVTTEEVIELTGVLPMPTEAPEDVYVLDGEVAPEDFAEP